MNTTFADGALWLSAFLFSTVCHEAAHAWSALKLGDATAYQGGQASFNPIPHIRREPFGMIVMPLLTYCLGGYVMGWASAPYDPEWARSHPRRLAVMSIAGPMANLALALAALLLLRLGLEWQQFHSTLNLSATQLVGADSEGQLIAARCLSVLFSLNLFLCLFNLLPIPPLDGSLIPLLALPKSWAQGYFRILASPLLRIGGFIFVMRGINFSMAPFYRAGTQLLFGNF